MDTLKIYDEWESDKEKKYGGQYGDSAYYARNCSKTNIKAFWIPFLCLFLPIFLIFGSDLLTFIIGLTFGLAAGFVGMLVGHKKNLTKAKEYGIPANSDAVKKELREFQVGVTTGVIAGTSIIKHSKNAIKDISNVDSWKEMK